jgi:hypothetical protein
MRYMCTHSLPPNAVTPDQLKQMAQAGQSDPTIRGYRSFVNLSQGKAICVIDAPDKLAVSSWFRKLELPFDSITAVEYEGDLGTIIEVQPREAAHA